MFLIICSGTLGYARPLESVADRQYNWGKITNPSEFEVLLGLEDCSLLGQRGILVVEGKTYKALVSDCKQKNHTWPSNYYLGDVSLDHLSYEKGFLILGDKK